MYKPESFECDVCRTEMTTPKGWYVLQVTEYALTITSFNRSLAACEPMVCGENCLHTLISQQLSALEGK